MIEIVLGIGITILEMGGIGAQILILKDLLKIEKYLKEYQRQKVEKEKKRTHLIQKDEVVARFIDDYMAASKKDSRQ